MFKKSESFCVNVWLTSVAGKQFSFAINNIKKVKNVRTKKCKNVKVKKSSTNDNRKK